MLRSGNGNWPVRFHSSMAASISAVHWRSGLSGVDLSSVTGMSLYGQRILCLVQLRLSFWVSPHCHLHILKGSSPLRENLVAADVPTLASITALAGLGVTAARGTTTRAGHCVSGFA